MDGSGEQLGASIFDRTDGCMGAITAHGLWVIEHSPTSLFRPLASRKDWCDVWMAEGGKRLLVFITQHLQRARKCIIFATDIRAKRLPLTVLPLFFR